MALAKVLITVKTYPTLSTKYEELVCTAGFREDGTWIRIYPVQFHFNDLTPSSTKNTSGTTFEFHLKNASNPFAIIGTFHPKPITRHNYFKDSSSRFHV